MNDAIAEDNLDMQALAQLTQLLNIVHMWKQ